MRASKTKRKVFLMMSGGIDSSVAAKLLLDQGYDVAGFYMKGWAPDWTDCIDPPERQASFDVAMKLGIPWHFLDYSKLFFDRVFDPMLSGYFSGLTPNPDTACNAEIKFGVFADYAFAHGADRIASGHYVRKGEDPLRLLVGKDPKKDQSYFLYDIKREVLERSLFPVGNFIKKDETMKLAREFGLPDVILNKKPTVDICFLLKKVSADGSPLGERITMSELLEREGVKRGIEFKPGDIVDEASGSVVGRHDGVMLYAFTVGQKMGYDEQTKFGVQGRGERMYVTRRDIPANTIYVSKEKPLSSEVIVRNLHWITDAPKFPFKGMAKIRTPQEMQACRAEMTASDELRVSFANSQHAVAPGQALVLYDGETVLGGGIIVR